MHVSTILQLYQLLVAGAAAAAAVHLRQLSTNAPLDGATLRGEDDQPLPLLIWHGLGDNYDSDGMNQISALAEDIHPGTLVYTISLAGDDADADRSATFLGNLTEQLEELCATLAAHPRLAGATAIDALGFSQGGQFLRGHVERCNQPPVRSLVTFGSQHNGITEFYACRPGDWLCLGAMALLRFNTWSGFVQSRLVPAQYYRDPADYKAYLDHSNFLADINNERSHKNPVYGENMAKLENFAMYLFEGDTVVVPRQTSWFEEVNGSKITPLRQRRLYAEDWLGLRELDRKGGLQFRSIAGDHMQIPLQVLNDSIREFFGPLSKSSRSTLDFQQEEL